MASITNFDGLLQKYKESKKELAETDDLVRRVYGNDPIEENNGGPGPSRFRRHSSSASDMKYSSRSYTKRQRTYDREGEKDYESLEDETLDEDSPSKRPALQSTIVAKFNAHRSRKAAIEEQKGNSKVKARNRRMFGALMGTLEKFQKEEKKRKDKDVKRIEIERKVEAATEKELEEIKKEKENLIKKRREMRSEVRCYEKKLERAECHEVYDATYKKILKSNSILTKTEPRIFFKPSTQTDYTKSCLEESQTIVKERLAAKEAAYAADLDEITESYKKESVDETEEIKCLEEKTESQHMVEAESESDSVIELVVEQEEPIDEEESFDDRRFSISLGDEEFEPIYD